MTMFTGVFTEKDELFQELASSFDFHYLDFENRGYDLCELEGIHIRHYRDNRYAITLLFPLFYGHSTVWFSLDDGDDLVDVITDATVHFMKTVDDVPF